jgi:NAD-dependent dihydropyrimidine dehydrogenase PreA subunit
MLEENHILFCHCSGCGVGSGAVRREVLAGLRGRGLAFTEVDDLCRLASGRNQELLALAASAGRLTVVACHPRAVRWMLSAAGVAAGADRLRVLDLRSMSSAEILEQMPVAAGAAVAAPPAAGDAWPPWFPVIDFSRCRHCRQCLSFCLFGVYALGADGKVIVASPRSCKNNCPACARICPEVAIMFPKLPDAEAPLNGDEIGDDTSLKARARINVREYLGDDIYAALARRRSRAGGQLLKPERERAEAERAAYSGGSAPGKTPTTAAAGAPPKG